jgi:hypothetical protein
LNLPHDPRKAAPETGTYVDRLAPDLLFWHVDQGIQRVSEWEAMASAEAPELPGDELSFTGLRDGTLFVDLDLSDEALEPLIEAIEPLIEAPYRAFARREEGDLWAVAAMRVDIVEVHENIPGDELDLAFQEGEPALIVDGQESGQRIATLEAFAAARFRKYVLHASRLDDLLWEVTVFPL